MSVAHVYSIIVFANVIEATHFNTNMVKSDQYVIAPVPIQLVLCCVFHLYILNFYFFSSIHSIHTHERPFRIFASIRMNESDSLVHSTDTIGEFNVNSKRRKRNMFFFHLFFFFFVLLIQTISSYIWPY